MVELINESNFDEKIKSGTGKVLVDFSATWCGPCRMLAPVLDEISQEYAGQVTIYKVDIDQCQSLAMNYRVSAVPTMVLFEDGQPVSATTGAQPKGNVLAFLGLK